MLKMITDETFMPDLKKSIHYISWTPYSSWSISGYSSLTWVYAVVTRKLSEKEAIAVFYEVDRNNETGTLYPAHNITIMPSRMQPYSDGEIYQHFNDAMKAQNEYIHAKNIVFDMRNYHYINPKTDHVDDEEYLKMIYHNERMDSIVAGSEDRHVPTYYILISKERTQKLINVPDEYASQAEVDFLSTPRQ